MYCSSCGAKNADTARFCQSCGKGLETSPPASPPPASTAPLAASPSTSGTLITILIVLVVVLIVCVAALAVGLAMKSKADHARETQQTETLNRLAADNDNALQPTTVEAAPSVTAEEAIAAAQVVLEKYLAADLGHDGRTMKQYLGGQAAARFDPQVQGQEDLTVHSQQVVGHTVKADNTLVFAVQVEWSAEGSSEVKTQTDRYVVKRTEAGWKITSTPAYPE